jgi:hypothetical protein
MSNYAKLKADFDEFDAVNPHIWGLLVKFSFDAKNAGLEKLGIKFLVERIRWELQVVTKSTDMFKINNNHTAFYARKLMTTYPELEGFFRFRKQR